ncbi:MAG: ribonuclease HII [Methylococcaceae bacterium]
MYRAGLDEVGRGCIAGPVIAAAVILPTREDWMAELTDSKKLTPAKRAKLADIIRTRALDWAVGRAEVDEIDRINILEASMLAMTRACMGLSLKPDHALVDGNRYPPLGIPGSAIIGGDALIPEISAASILAKVVRDDEMVLMDRLFPGYGFSIHKGYPTQLHQELLKQLGVTPVHRSSFKPVKKLLASE